MGKPTIENYKMLAAAMVGQKAEDLCCCEYIIKNIKNNVIAKYGVDRAIRPFKREYDDFMKTYYNSLRFLKRSLANCTDPVTIRSINLDIVRLKRRKKLLQLRADKGLARAVILYFAKNEKENILLSMEDPKFHIISEIGGDAIAYRAKKSVARNQFKPSNKNPIYFIKPYDISLEINNVAKRIVDGEHTYQEAIV